ncbi:MAG: hypothetical protein ACLVJ6_10305 [Merdibacter sp.]
MATLDQILMKKSSTPSRPWSWRTIQIQYRGIVEGFCGFPYSVEDRLPRWNI